MFNVSVNERTTISKALSTVFLRSHISLRSFLSSHLFLHVVTNRTHMRVVHEEEEETACRRNEKHVARVRAQVLRTSPRELLSTSSRIVRTTYGRLKASQIRKPIKLTVRHLVQNGIFKRIPIQIRRCPTIYCQIEGSGRQLVRNAILKKHSKPNKETPDYNRALRIDIN